MAESEGLLFAVPPPEVLSLLERMVAKVDCRPTPAEVLASPLTPGMTRPTHTGSLQMGGRAVGCYKLSDGTLALNARDLAALLGVSVEALQSDARFHAERGAGGVHG